MAFLLKIICGTAACMHAFIHPLGHFKIGFSGGVLYWYITPVFPLFSAVPRNPTAGLCACDMAVRFLIPRASKTLSHHLLHSPPSRLDSIPSAAGVSGCLRALHSVVSRSSHPFYRRGILPPFSRFMVSDSSPRLDLAEAVSSALDIDSRVPATVITGFLGSGKVSSLFPFITQYQMLLFMGLWGSWRVVCCHKLRKVFSFINF